jgi:hypothetical protein
VRSGGLLLLVRKAERKWQIPDNCRTSQAIFVIFEGRNTCEICFATQSWRAVFSPA